jgi:hypothetical protein
MNKILLSVIAVSFNFFVSAQGYYGVLANEVYIVINGTTYQAGNTINLTGSGPFSLQNIFVKTEKWVRGGGTSNICGGTISWDISGGSFGSVNLSFDQDLGQQGNNDIQQWTAAPGINLSFPNGSSSLGLTFNITGREGGTDCGQTKTFNFSFNSILPVFFESFEVVIFEKSNILYWQTHSETNHSHYEIERSEYGQHWTTLGKVSDNLSRSSKKYYEFVDHFPVKGRNYYRIKQVDVDGTFAYSEIRFVNLNTEENKLLVFPNPSFDKFIKIEYASTINPAHKLSIHNLTGQKIQEKYLNSDQVNEYINFSDKNPGIYFITIIDQQGKALQSQKVIIH